MVWTIFISTSRNRETVEKILDRQIERLSGPVQPGSSHPAVPGFVVMDLELSNADTLSQLGLRQAFALAGDSQLDRYCIVDRITCPLWQNRLLPELDQGTHLDLGTRLPHPMIRYPKRSGLQGSTRPPGASLRGLGIGSAFIPLSDRSSSGLILWLEISSRD